MTYVITKICESTCDTACVRACPVDCIDGPVTARTLQSAPHDELRAKHGKLQLYIDPDLCIGCACCEPVCPVSAIFEDINVPAEHEDDLATNAAFFAR
jgi:ferredoxin